jgi:DNA polymerase elongation subunit (family B)
MPLVVESIEYIGTTNDYVYDLETEDGTFAGSCDVLGKDILLKNTDSCYVTFDVQKEDYTDENGVFNEVEFMKENFRLAKECALKISSYYKKPICLEFEKVMYPFFLYAKKRYAYKEWVVPNQPNNIEYKGLSLIRRDFCQYVKYTCDKIFRILMNDKSISYEINDNKFLIKDTLSTSEIIIIDLSTLEPNIRQILESENNRYKDKEVAILYAREIIKDLLIKKNISIEDLTLSKSLKNTYKLKGIPVKWTLGLCSVHQQQKQKGHPCSNCESCSKNYGIKAFFKGSKQTKELNECNECKNNYVIITGPHVRIANRLRNLDPINGPKPPDRVNFVYTDINNWYNKKQYEFAIHPSEITNVTKINYLYYFYHQLQEPMYQIFSALVDNPENLFKQILLEATGQKMLTFSVADKKIKTQDDDEEE